MDLILWRHAEAEEGTEGLPDARRRLTKRGEKQARKMADWLGDRLPGETRILVSPTERTRQTADALGLPFEIDPGIGPGADPARLLAAAGWPEGKGKGSDAVLLVGHQPTLGRLAALLLSGSEANWTIKKGAAWWFSSRSGNEEIVVRAVVGPELL